MSAHTAGFLLLGAASGAVAAALVCFCQMGDVGAPQLLGFCFGIFVAGHCGGLDASFYVFPGLIFGVLFVGAELWRGCIDATRGGVFVLASTIANAVAVFLCVGLLNVFTSLSELNIFNLPLALAGAIAGAVAGVLLGAVTMRLVPASRAKRSILVASGLGLLVPLVPEGEIGGTFAFFIVWQSGYAAALAASLVAKP